MIPFWYLIVAVLATALVSWWAGRGRLKAERKLRMAAQADAREGTFAVGRVEVATATAEALTRVVTAETEGLTQARLTPADPELPPRVWLALPDSVPPAVAHDATMLAADHPPLAMTSVMRAGDLGDYAYVTAVEVDDPDAQVLVAGARDPVVLQPDPDEPYDVEEVDDGDEPERPGPPPRLDDTDSGGTALAVEVPAPQTAGHRYAWAHLTGEALPASAPYGVMPDPKLSRLTRSVVRRLRAKAWLADPRGAVERLLRRPIRLLGQMKAGASWGWQPGQATAVARGPERRPAGRHRPEVVAAARASQPRQRPRRVLRADWRDHLRSPRRTVLSNLPSLECTP